jgi:hypothetical protein
MMNTEMNEIIARVATAPEGERIVYHTGFIGQERGSGNTMRDDLSFLANKMYELYLSGDVELVQKRIANPKLKDGHEYQYIAVVMPRRNKTERAIRNTSLHNSVRSKGGIHHEPGKNKWSKKS